MSYHKFATTCMVCDGTGKGFAAVDATEGTVLKCVTCKGTGKEEYGSFEVFEVAVDEHGIYPPLMSSPGWYWWACFPGCMPEGDPEGPFATEQDAIDNAQEG